MSDSPSPDPTNSPTRIPTSHDTRWARRLTRCFAARGRCRRWTGEILLVVALLVAVQWWQSRGMVQGAAPPLVGLTTEGRSFQLDPREGPYLVHFWATWCPICRLEEGTIDSLADRAPVITVAMQSGTADEVADYLTGQGLDFPVLVDEQGALAQHWGVSAVPASFVVDTSGRITSRVTGYSTWLGLRWRLWLAD